MALIKVIKNQLMYLIKDITTNAGFGKFSFIFF